MLLPIRVHDQVIGVDAADTGGEVPSGGGAVGWLIGRRKGSGGYYRDACRAGSAASGQRAAAAISVALASICQGDAADGVARKDCRASSLGAAAPQSSPGRTQVGVEVARRCDGAGGRTRVARSGG